MLLTLLAALNTNDLLEVVKHLSMAPLDIDLLLYEAQKDGSVKLDKKNGKIEALKEPETLYYSAILVPKLVAIIEQYDEQGANITRSRLEQDTLNLAGQYGYLIHDFVCTMYALEQGKVDSYPKVNKYEISVPEIKGKRPGNKFVFYTFKGHEEYGAKAVNDFIDQWAKLKTK